LEVFERRPPTAVFAVPSVIGRHPKTFTTADIANVTKCNAAASFMTLSSSVFFWVHNKALRCNDFCDNLIDHTKHDISRLPRKSADAQACGLAQIRSPNNCQCATTTLDPTMVEVPYD
jgi:hypothetical protein